MMGLFLETRGSASYATTGENMEHTENDYIQAGYKFERGFWSLARFERMLEREAPAFRSIAITLFNRGRLEARS